MLILTQAVIFHTFSNDSHFDSATSWWDIKEHDDFPDLLIPEIDVYVDKEWVQGELLNESDQPFNIYDIENLIESYKRNQNK